MSKKTTGLPFVMIADMTKSKDVDLSRWKSVPLPIESDAIDDAHQSGNQWRFLIEDNQLLIVQQKSQERLRPKLPFSEAFTSRLGLKFAGRKIVKKVDNGYLFGIYHGEHGGGLYFVSDDESEFYSLTNLLVDDLRIHDFFQVESKFFAIEGLGHKSISEGQIIEIYKDDVWKYRTIADLKGSPCFIHPNGDGFLIVTDNSLFKLTKNVELVHVLEAPISWNILYPTSVYFNRNEIFIAMRKRILKIENYESNPAFEWYVPK